MKKYGSVRKVDSKGESMNLMSINPPSFWRRILYTFAISFGLFGLSVQSSSAQPYVTILYQTWSNYIFTQSGFVGNDVANQQTETGYTAGYNWWGKPLWAETHGDGTTVNNYLYYFNGDPNQVNTGLIDYHASLLSSAGIDFITIDFSNFSADANGPILEAAQALCSRFAWRQQMGLPTPQVIFFVRNAATLQSVYNTFYSGQYPSSLFFNYQGRPLALVTDPNNNGNNTDRNQPYAPTGGIFDSFTCRHCWALDNSSSFWQIAVPSSTPPQPCYYNGVPEEMSAAFACQTTYMTRDGQYADPDAQGRSNGAFFNTYMAAAQQTKPTFTFITGWNEWGCYNSNYDGDFTPPPPAAFVDNWMEKYSKDAEPEAAGDPQSHGYQYYDLLAEQVARLKGNFPVVDGGTYEIISQNSQLVLDVTGFNPNPGTQLQQWSVTGNSNQEWTFQDLHTGYWTIISALDGLALDNDGATPNDVGAAIDEASPNGSYGQQWSLRPQGDGSWKLVNRASGLLLDIANVSTSDGGLAHQWTDVGGSNQHWYIQPYYPPAVPYSFAANEGYSYTFNQPVDVAFGANGNYLYQHGVAGTIAFNTTAFGSDPALGFYKTGYYSPFAVAGSENTSQTFTAPVDIGYGANGNYVYLYGVTGSITFNNDTFGGDPSPGTPKTAYYRTSMTSQQPIPVPGSVWSYLVAAREQGSFTFTQPVDVAYGANGNYIYERGVSGTIAFNNSAFGSDPAPGAVKTGYFSPFAIAGAENTSQTFTTPVDIGYGANGNYIYLYGVTGTITFNNSTFGSDPSPGNAKTAYYRTSFTQP